MAEAGDADGAIAASEPTSPMSPSATCTCRGAGGIKVAQVCGGATRIVILTVSEQERHLLDAVAAGAVGCLIKSTPGPELRRALWKAAGGEPVFSPALAALVLGEFRKLAKASSGGPPLSEREREILQLVARGHAYKEIGTRLFIADVGRHTF